MRPMAAVLLPIRNCLRVQGALMFFGVDVVRMGIFLLLGTKNTTTAKFTDKNVVSDPEKVADPQNQDVTRTS